MLKSYDFKAKQESKAVQDSKKGKIKLVTKNFSNVGIKSKRDRPVSKSGFPSTKIGSKTKASTIGESPGANKIKAEVVKEGCY